jgi:SNF2 family DNA or RNA helicase
MKFASKSLLSIRKKDATNLSRHSFPGGITFHTHLGPDRHKETEMKLNFEKDIVFTTFATVAAEFRRGNSPLAKIHWYRIVLDEGMCSRFLHSSDISLLKN